MMDLLQIAERLGLNEEDMPDILSAAMVEAYQKHQNTGDKASIDVAVQCAQLVTNVTPEDHPDRAGRLNNLGVMLQCRYERTGQMEDLEEAITAARQAVESTPEDDPNRAAWLNNLGNKLGRRYERTGEMGDLEEAIAAARQAVQSTPEDHPDWAACLNNLGNKLESRYKRTEDMGDLEEAITAARNNSMDTNMGYFDPPARVQNVPGRHSMSTEVRTSVDSRNTVQLPQRQHTRNMSHASEVSDGNNHGGID